MPDAISSIMPMLSSAGNGISGLSNGTLPLWQMLLGLGAGGAGSVGNILASNKRNQVLNQQLQTQANLMNIMNNPSLIAQGAAKIEQPLSAGLTQSVGNATQGYLAERGLSQAPGIQASTLAQGLAPFQQQEQQMAIQAYLTSLGLPAQAAARFLPTPSGTSMTSLWQSLFGGRGNPSSGLPTTNGITTGPFAAFGAMNNPIGVPSGGSDWLGQSTTDMQAPNFDTGGSSDMMNAALMSYMNPEFGLTGQ